MQHLRSAEPGGGSGDGLADVSGWRVVRRVVDFARHAAFQRGADDANQIVAVNHVQPACAVALDFCFAAQELFKRVAAARPVDSGHAQNHRRELPFRRRR
jgi:hypothetical protein